MQFQRRFTLSLLRCLDNQTMEIQKKFICELAYSLINYSISFLYLLLKLLEWPLVLFNIVSSLLWPNLLIKVQKHDFSRRLILKRKHCDWFLTKCVVMPHFVFFLDFLFPPLPLRCAHCVKRRLLLSIQPQPYSFSTVTVMLLQLCWRNQVGGGGGGWLGNRNLLFAHKYLGVIRRKIRSEQHALYKKITALLLFSPLLQNNSRFTASSSLPNSILTAILMTANPEKWYWDTQVVLREGH